jgi:hypothetical protein
VANSCGRDQHDEILLRDREDDRASTSP